MYGTFSGYFHGGGKKITVNMEYPLFGGLSGSGATIDSLILDGYIYTDDIGIAGIAGSIFNGSVISNCINNATIICTDDGSRYGAFPKSAIAAIVSNSTIINCINNGDITGVDNVGGIAGDNQTGTIINCINTGKITATNSGSAPNGCSGVGGIAAFHKNNISNCINLGTVEGQNNVGGIVGWASPLGNTASQITNCVNYGYIKGINNVGGILGYMFYPYVNISNCVNAGVVVGSSDVGSITGKE